MAFADSNRGQVLSVPEKTHGTAAQKGFQMMRFTSSDFSANKNTTVSDEIRSDRMVSDITEVGFTSTGTVNYEFSLQSTYDEWLEAALCGVWTRGNKFRTATKANYTVTNTNQFNLTGAGTPAFVAGQKITVEGDSVNKGTYTVSSVGDGYVIVTETLTNVAQNADTTNGDNSIIVAYDPATATATTAAVCIYSDEVYASGASNHQVSVTGTNTYDFPVAITVPAEWYIGMWVYVSGFTGNYTDNNGWKQITAITSGAGGTITVSGTLVNVTSTDKVSIRGKSLRNGIQKRSFQIEQGFADVGQFFLYKGQRIGTWSMDISSGSTITGSFGFQGTEVSRDNASRSWFDSYTATTSSSTINATSNVGDIYSTFGAGSPITDTTVLQSISFNIDNALRDQLAVGDKYPKGIGYGRQTVSGSLTAYFSELSTFYSLFLNHTDTALALTLEETSAESAARMRISLPKVKFQTDNPNIGGIDQDVVENIDFTAFMYTHTDSKSFQIQIDMIPYRSLAS